MEFGGKITKTKEITLRGVFSYSMIQNGMTKEYNIVDYFSNLKI